MSGGKRRGWLGVLLGQQLHPNDHRVKCFSRRRSGCGRHVPVVAFPTALLSPRSHDADGNHRPCYVSLPPLFIAVFLPINPIHIILILVMSLSAGGTHNVSIVFLFIQQVLPLDERQCVFAISSFQQSITPRLSFIFGLITLKPGGHVS